jgi:hypothetical protein
LLSATILYDNCVCLKGSKMAENAGMDNLTVARSGAARNPCGEWDPNLGTANARSVMDPAGYSYYRLHGSCSGDTAKDA